MPIVYVSGGQYGVCLDPSTVSSRSFCYGHVNMPYYGAPVNGVNPVDDTAIMAALSKTISPSNQQLLGTFYTSCLVDFLPQMCSYFYWACIPTVNINDPSTFSTSIYQEVGLSNVPLPFMRPCIALCDAVNHNKDCANYLSLIPGQTTCATLTKNWGNQPSSVQLPLMYDTTVRGSCSPSTSYCTARANADYLVCNNQKKGVTVFPGSGGGGSSPVAAPVAVPVAAPVAAPVGKPVAAPVAAPVGKPISSSVCCIIELMSAMQFCMFLCSFK